MIRIKLDIPAISCLLLAYHFCSWYVTLLSPPKHFFPPISFVLCTFFLFAFCSYAAERLTSQATVHSPLKQADVKPTTLRVTCKYKRDSVDTFNKILLKKVPISNKKSRRKKKGFVEQSSACTAYCTT